MKFGLLRALASTKEPLRLGVNWYLTGDENHNADGKHTSYLHHSNIHYGSLNACDADLMSRLAGVVATTRSVAALETAGVLPVNSLTFSAPLSGPMGHAGRYVWHKRALAALSDADLIFVDPDNGIRTTRSGPNPQKFAFMEELADYAARGQSLVVYHHADRTSGGIQAQVPRRLDQLAEATGFLPIGAVVARRGSCRFFLVVPAPAHRDRLAEALAVHAAGWMPHSEFHPFQAK
jgi:hypothetical protein